MPVGIVCRQLSECSSLFIVPTIGGPSLPLVTELLSKSILRARPKVNLRMIFLDVLLECGPKLDRCFLRTSIVWKNEPLSTRGALVVDRVTALPRFDDQVNVVVHFCNLTGWNRAKSYWRRRLVSERSLPFGLCEIKVHLFCFFQGSGNVDGIGILVQRNIQGACHCLHYKRSQGPSGRVGSKLSEDLSEELATGQVMQN